MSYDKSVIYIPVSGSHRTTLLAPKHATHSLSSVSEVIPSGAHSVSVPISLAVSRFSKSTQVRSLPKIVICSLWFDLYHDNDR